VATEDDRIAHEVRSIGGQVVMTSPDCENGTARCAEAIEQLGDVADTIVNLQGDAPLSPSFVVGRLVDRLTSDRSGAVMATPAVRCSQSVYSHLMADQAAGRVGGTSVVFDRNGHALYFSKSVIPHLPTAAAEENFPPVHLHLGLYAYRPEALRQYARSEASAIELLEGLEQLRFLDLGLPIAVEPIDALEWDSIELNNPSDIPVIEAVLKARGIE
jgi:3-deoxy-manno-octulosonate cytidylyltransferase (CMP-KDO synthetase)